MTTPSAAPKFGVKFPSRKERSVKRVTKCETREIQKRLEPPKPPPVRSPPKPKAPKKPKPPPATLCKPPKPARILHHHYRQRQLPLNPRRTSTSSNSSSTSRTLQLSDIEKLARLNCSREFSLFHQYIKSELSKCYENQLAFLQTKLQHLKNEFVNKQSEHLNFEQIKEYYDQAVKDHIRRKIKPDEYLTLSDKFKQDTKQAIDKWIKKKDFKPPRQVNEYLARRQERIRDRIKETIAEQKRQQLTTEAASENTTQSSITMTPITTSKKPATTTTATVNDDDDIMIID